MRENKTVLSISTEVLEKMAAVAATEVEGVKELVKRSVDLKDAVRGGNAFKSVKVESVNGAVEISIYITVGEDVKVREVAEAVQLNVKDKIQTMTGTAVTKVNVIVADIIFASAEAETEE